MDSPAGHLWLEKGASLVMPPFRPTWMSGNVLSKTRYVAAKRTVFEKGVSHGVTTTFDWIESPTLTVTGLCCSLKLLARQLQPQ